MRVYLTKMCIEDAPAAHDPDQLSLSKKQTAKRRKEDIFCDKSVLAVSENTLMYYTIMRYFILRRVGTLMLQLTGS